MLKTASGSYTHTMSATRRTSPRLAGYYAARAAAAEQRASAFALVDSVLAFKPAEAVAVAAPAEAGKRRSPRLAAAAPVAEATKRTSPRLAPATTERDNDTFVRLARLAAGVLYGILVTGAYWACEPLSEEEASAWIADPKNARLVATTIRGWIRADPLKARRMGETEVEEALLEGDVWVAVMRDIVWISVMREKSAV